MENWGGGEEFLLNLCKNTNGFNFLIASPAGETLTKFASSGIKTVTVNSLKKIYRTSGKWNLINVLSVFFNLFFSTLILIRVVSKEKIKLVVANGNFAGLYALPLRFFSKVKIVSVQHLIYENPTYEKKIIKWLYNNSSAIVCVSDAVRNELISYIHIDSKNKIQTIYNGIKLPAGQPEENTEVRKLIRIGMVGSIIIIKGIDLVLEVINSLKNKFSFQFHIYGGTSNTKDSTDYNNELVDFVRKNNLQEVVFFHGNVESKDEIYKNLDILISFSTIPEAFPFSLLEAMSYKNLVISADAGGPGEIITNNENGFLIEPGNKIKLEKILSYILNNFSVEEVTKIRNSACNSVKEKYSLKIFSDKYEKLFNSILNLRSNK